MSFLTNIFQRFRTTSDSATPRDSERMRPEAVLTRHAGRLMRVKGVLSVGVGRTPDGRPAIVIGLDNDSPATLASLPEVLDGVPVVRNTTGRINAM